MELFVTLSASHRSEFVIIRTLVRDIIAVGSLNIRKLSQIMKAERMSLLDRSKLQQLWETVDCTQSTVEENEILLSSVEIFLVATEFLTPIFVVFG
jgi:hypothetical protein